MTSHIIFSQQAWLKSEIGFAGLYEIYTGIQSFGVKIKYQRDYQAVIFDIDDINKQIIDFIREKLPDGFKIPALLDGSCYIISKKDVAICDARDKIFTKLLKEAHLKIKNGKPEEESYLQFSEVDNLIDRFAEKELNLLTLKELNVNNMLKIIEIPKEFRNKLIGILIDIKSIWFALEYDLNQLAKNTDNDPVSRFKRYIYINNAIVRIRAIWQRLIGLAILVEDPKKINKILDARRVRRAFINNFKDSKNTVTKIVWDYIHSLDSFEQKFRTPELHKIGRTLRWASSEKIGYEINRFITFRNDINRVLRHILKNYDLI